MKRRKDTVTISAVALVLVLLLGELCMEFRFQCHEIVLKSDNRASIFRRIPEAEITEDDRTFFEEIFACPGAAALAGGGESGDLYATEDFDIRAVSAAYLGEREADTLSVSVIVEEDGNVTEYLDWGDHKGDIFLLERTDDGDGASYFKFCSFHGLFGRRTSCENWDNERVQESVLRRRWFGWLRNRMWED